MRLFDILIFNLTNFFEQESGMTLDPIIERLKESPCFNSSSWQELVSDTNDEVASSMLQKYLANLRDSEGTLENLLLAENFGEIQKLAHKLTSTSKILGFWELGEKCQNLQVLIKTSKDPNIIRTQSEHLKKMIQQILSITY